jgi:predicted ATPase/DNA-binding SARP family transcriptional activator
MEYRVLGPLEVIDDDVVVALNAAKPRALLAMLLLRANEFVSNDRLIDDLWEDKPPATAGKVLQTYISQLRRTLGQEVIETGPGGYRLRVDPERVDLLRFRRLVADGRGGEREEVASRLREALALWRGEPLVEFSHQAWARGEAERLDAVRLDAVERRIEADLAAGRDRELIDELETLVGAHPLRERARAQLMLALYRAGRQADALAAYRAAREASVESLGLEPGARLRDLERAILHQDPSLDHTTPGAPLRGHRSAGLPARATSFVGRARELEEIREQLTANAAPLLTLTGPPGTGKTRLAIEAAAGLNDAFADGVVLVELAPLRDPALLVTTIAAALGVREEPERPLGDIVASALRARRLLVVLDNFEQLILGAALLSGFLDDVGETRFLVTSRAPLDIPGEAIYPVPSLELPGPGQPRHVVGLRQVEAVRLFAERAQAARPDFVLSDENVGVIAELCVRLDGLPLALELAAARVKILTPSAILERLDAQLEHLRAEPGSGAPQRHRTLWAAIEWSYALLEPTEQRLFASLGAFVDGFTLGAAEAVAGDPELDIVEGVESLLRNNLVRTDRMAGGEPRFGMLETIREHALERLAGGNDLEGVRRRHALFYLDVAGQAHTALLGPEQRTWLERLDADRGNLRAALAWTIECGETDTGLRSGAALWRYWQFRGAAREGRATLERLLDAPNGSKLVRALAEARIASLALVQGDHEAVRRLGESSLQVFRRIGDAEHEAAILGVMAVAALAFGDGEQALRLAEEGVDAARRSGDPMIETYAASSLGMVRAWSGDFEEAERLLRWSIQEASRLGNVRSVANWSRILGGVLHSRGDSESARALIEESLALHRTLDDAWGISHASSSLALLMVDAQDAGAARRLVEESISIERDVGDAPGLIFNIEVYARLAASERRNAQAVRLYACASGLSDTIGSHRHSHEVDWIDRERDIEELRSRLGEQEFADAWKRGRMMTLDEALEDALASD